MIKKFSLTIIALVVILFIIALSEDVKSEYVAKQMDFIDSNRGSVKMNLTTPEDFLEHNNKTLEEMPEDMWKLLYEFVDMDLIEKIKNGTAYPDQKLINSGIGTEEIEGDVYSLYYDSGIIYISSSGGRITRGHDTATFPGGVLFAISTDKLIEMGVEPTPPDFGQVHKDNNIKNYKIIVPVLVILSAIFIFIFWRKAQKTG